VVRAVVVVEVVGLEIEEDVEGNGCGERFTVDPGSATAKGVWV
jgi:hypothetical protein